MKIMLSELREIIREETRRLHEASSEEDVDELVEQAKKAVEADMKQRPPSVKDGIWRFDRIIDTVFGTARRDKEFWLEVERIARKKNVGARFGSWTGYSVVASYAQSKAAYATPGFAAARRRFMS